MAVEQVLVERKHRQGVNLVQHDGRSSLENTRILQGLIVAFRHRKNHRLHIFAQVEIGWAHQIAHVLDDDEVKLVQIEHINGTADHIAFQMACPTRIDLHSSNALGFDLLGINRRSNVSLDNRNVEFVAQCLDGGKDG